jgi:hypothetical protein
MVRSAIAGTTSVKFVYKNGAVELGPPVSVLPAHQTAIA